MNRLNLKQGIIGLILITSVILSGCVPIVSAAQAQNQVLKTHPSRGDVQVVDNASSQLVTGINGATLNIDTTGLEPNHAYTVWFVVINKPEACVAVPCTSKEVLTATEEIDAEVGYATGAIADENGAANFFAHMNLGDLPGQWFDNGFTNPNGEIHAVIMSHGPAIAAMEEEMTSTLRGGCTDESVPAPFPATAHADGKAGPNSCQLYQFVIFERG
ncbi:hypothetical protein KFU94_10155 [Chloroflexi bacterium TSY]|nr:hypothetical protein [Chloroflexi bacterium TSY]